MRILKTQDRPERRKQFDVKAKKQSEINQLTRKVETLAAEVDRLPSPRQLQVKVELGQADSDYVKQCEAKREELKDLREVLSVKQEAYEVVKLQVESKVRMLEVDTREKNSAAAAQVMLDMIRALDTAIAKSNELQPYAKSTNTQYQGVKSEFEVKVMTLFGHPVHSYSEWRRDRIREIKEYIDVPRDVEYRSVKA